MNRSLIKFHLSLILILVSAFFIHNYVNHHTYLLLLYIINFLIAVFVYLLVFVLRNSQKEYLGFYFLGGTFLKFTVFFLFVLPIFKEDGTMSSSEFLAFFVPYILSLIIETRFLILLLNSKQ